MPKRHKTNRRTVLQTLGAATLGGVILPGRVTANEQDGGDMPISLEITAPDSDLHEFSLDTHSLSAGWNTITFTNNSSATHFALIEKLPTGAATFDPGDLTYVDYFWKEVSAPFQKFYDDLYVPGSTREDYNREGWPEIDLPGPPGYGFAPWFFDPGVVYYGGAGLTSPGGTATTTVHLDPGEYLIECYVKEANAPYEDFHSYHGMLEHVTVEDGPGGREPRSSFDVTLTNKVAFPIGMEGVMSAMTTNNHVRPGDHTIKVDYLDQTVYSNLVGHDAHLVRLDDVTGPEVSTWMNWAEPGQLVSDGTEPGPFLGGVQDVMTGDYPAPAYFDVTLEAGKYALVSEIPGPHEQGYLETITVGP